MDSLKNIASNLSMDYLSNLYNNPVGASYGLTAPLKVYNNLFESICKDASGFKLLAFRTAQVVVGIIVYPIAGTAAGIGMIVMAVKLKSNKEQVLQDLAFAYQEIKKAPPSNAEVLKETKIWFLSFEPKAARSLKWNNTTPEKSYAAVCKQVAEVSEKGCIMQSKVTTQGNRATITLTIAADSKGLGIKQK